MKNIALVWEITVYLLKNHFAQIAGYMFLFLGLGFLLSFVYSIFLYRYKWLSRTPKYYNWLAKLHIPIIFIINIYFGLQIGVLYGGYKIIQKETVNLSKQAVSQAANWAFESEEDKQTSLKKLQSVAKSLQEHNKEMKLSLLDIAKAYNSDKPLEKVQNKLVSKILDKYGDRIYSLILYGLLSKVPNIKIAEQMSFEEFDMGVQYLLNIDHQELEQSIANKLADGTNYLVKSQFKSLLIPILIFWILLMATPFAEYGIYKYVVGRRENHLSKPDRQ